MMKIIITRLEGYSERMGEFKVEEMIIKSKDGTVRELLPQITRATGGPIPVLAVDSTPTESKKPEKP